jgi:hypothetical protein
MVSCTAYAYVQHAGDLITHMATGHVVKVNEDFVVCTALRLVDGLSKDWT